MVIGLQLFACFVLLCRWVYTHMFGRGSAGFRLYERQLVCSSVNVTKGMKNGKGTYSGRQGSDPIRLR